MFSLFLRILWDLFMLFKTLYNEKLFNTMGLSCKRCLSNGPLTQKTTVICFKLSQDILREWSTYKNLPTHPNPHKTQWSTTTRQQPFDPYSRPNKYYPNQTPSSSICIFVTFGHEKPWFQLLRVDSMKLPCINELFSN